MPAQNKSAATDEWDDGDSPAQGAANGGVKTASPASPSAPGKSANCPPNASRDDCLRIKASAEAALKKDPTYKAAELVIAEANERLRYFTPSGLAVPRAPVETDDEDAPQQPGDKFPDNAKDARELHAKIKREVVRTIPQRDAKRNRLSKLATHISKLESGLPTIHVAADDHAAMYATRDAGIKRMKLEMLARQIPEVKTLLADHDTLKKAFDDLGKVQRELATENAELKARTVKSVKS